MHEPVPVAGEVPVHGGDLTAATARYGEPAAGWLDLSTGINPVPYPFAPPSADVFARLPGVDDEAALVTAARSYLGTPAAITVGAGSQAFIQNLPRLRAPGTVGVLAPTYGEHAQAWAANGHSVREVADPVDLAGFDVAVVVNPNNPDGRVVAPGELSSLTVEMAARGGLLVVDEAFADVEPAASVAGKAGDPGLVVLRSFGKFFGLAGVRLGFALSDDALAADLKRLLGPWPVSGPALHVGRQALGDTAWQARTRHRLRQSQRRLDEILGAAGLRVLGGTMLFRLVETDGPALHRQLAARGIWTRIFAHSPHRLRIGLPGPEPAWARLEAALMANG